MATDTYELILMLDPQAADEQREKLASEAKARLESGGEIAAESAWGLRKMAYEIRQRTEADYRYFRFQAGKDVLDGLDHALKIADGVLRFRIFKVDPDSPMIEPPDTAQVMRRDEDDDRGRGRRGGPRRPRRDDAEQGESAAPEPAPAAAPSADEGEPAGD